MFMFQNGLLMSFIPEILMVIGYVLCLFTPAVKPQNDAFDSSAVVLLVSTAEHQSISSYQVTFSDFQNHAEFVTIKKQVLSIFIQKVVPINYKSTFSTTDGLSYVDFSRPPPGFLS